MPRREAPMVYIDPKEWVRFKQQCDRDVFGKALLRGMRKEVKALGALGARRVQERLAESTPAGNPAGDGLDAISSSVRTVVSFTPTSAGVRITASAAALEARHKGLLNVYNTKAFRNPIATTGRGKPYFGSVLVDVFDKEMVGKMRVAMRKATDAIGARGE